MMFSKYNESDKFFQISSFYPENMTIARKNQFAVFFLLLMNQTLKGNIGSLHYILFKFSNFLLTHDVQV